MSVVFEIPERRTAADGSTEFLTRLKTPFTIPVSLACHQGRLIPDMTVQSHIQALQTQVLESLSKSTNLFKVTPRLEQLRAIAPVWGIVIVGGELKWNSANIWPNERLEKTVHAAHLQLQAVEISRLTILPVWAVVPDKKEPVIDLDFGGEDEKDSDVCSIHSSDLDDAADGASVVRLIDRNERKRISKANARELMRVAAEAQMSADAARDRFYAEFDLSEDESELSADDDSDVDEE